MAKTQFKDLSARFLRDKAGATAIEYGLVIGLVAMVATATVSRVGPSITAKFNTIASQGLGVDSDTTGTLSMKRANHQITRIQ